MKNKKAQLQNMETIMVVIILSIFLVVGLLFMSSRQSEAGIQEARKSNTESALAIATQLANLPELRCTKLQTATERCIDFHKAQAFSKYLEENPNYKIQTFGNTNISIIMISPETKNLNIASPFNPRRNTAPLYIPLIVQDSVTSTNYFSILEVVTHT